MQKDIFQNKCSMKLQRPCLYEISLKDAPGLIRKVQSFFLRRRILITHYIIMYRLLRSAPLLRELWSYFPATCSMLQGRRRGSCKGPRIRQRLTRFVSAVPVLMIDIYSLLCTSKDWKICHSSSDP